MHIHYKYIYIYIYHRNHITAGTEAHVISDHFTKCHNISNIKVKPIEVCTDLKTLRDRERFWMREINTLFPYGLNDRYDKDD